jgi:FkbM family methyltransferase
MSAPSRLYELFADGGITEVSRGVRDYLLINTPVPVYRAVSSVSLDVGHVSVELLADSGEAIWRGSGHGERPVMRDVLAELQQDDHLWDIGANIGSYALVAAAAGADVTAFEPGPQARAELLANADHNDLAARIDATPYALADWTGQGVLLPAERAGIRELVGTADRGDTVPVARGSDLAFPQPDLIKIDVEGAELAVLDGLGETLSDCRVCYVEIHEPDVDPAAVKQRLRDAGFEIAEQWTEIVKATRGARDD